MLDLESRWIVLSVTAKLICAVGFAYACCFSFFLSFFFYSIVAFHEAAQMVENCTNICKNSLLFKFGSNTILYKKHPQ